MGIAPLAVVGKPEPAAPVTNTLSLSSNLNPYAASFPDDPKQVAHSRLSKVGFSLNTTPSCPPALLGWKLPAVVGKLEEEKLAIYAFPELSTIISPL